MTKKFVLFLVMIGVVAIIGGIAAAAISNYNDMLIRQTTPKTEFLFSMPKPGEEMIIVYLVTNISGVDKEIIYDLTADVGMGGIGATIDYDGSSGPKSPEPYHWQKVPVAAGEKQYLIIRFPLADGWITGTKITPSVRLVLPPRG